VNRLLTAALWGVTASLPVASFGLDEMTPEERLPPLASDGWWNDPKWNEFLDLINPFATPPLPREPRYVDPYGWQFLQDPFRIGFTKHDEVDVIPAADVSGRGASGSMQITEFYSWARYSFLYAPDVLVNLTGIFDGYYWSGPTQPQLPGQVDRLSLDMEGVLLGNGPVTTTIGFHPQLVADFEHPLTNQALNFDGRVVNTHRISPEWLLVYGLAVWDRVNVLFIPEVGAVWTPNDRWELRMLFPRSQFSYRLGEIGGGQTWLTSVVEYVVQAYQVNIEDADRLDRIQIRDWRATFGLRQDFYRISWGADIGIVFNRRVSFQGTTPGFHLDPSALFRVSFWF
jgi:hypothetical protein